MAPISAARAAAPPDSRMTKPSRALLLSPLAAATLASCAGIGPASIATQRPGYSEVIAATDERELLINVVRLRYLDTPLFLRVASVTASPSLETALRSEASVDGDGDFGGGVLEPRVVYTDAPTIVYSPLDGREFAHELLLPIEPATVFLMVHNGFDFGLVARLLLRSLNGLTNDRNATPGERAAFRRVTAELAELVAEGLLRLGTPPEGLDRERPRLVFRVDPDTHDDPRGQRVLESLGLAPGIDTIQVGFGLAHDESTIAVETRSLLALLAHLSGHVDVPEDDLSVVWPVPETSTEAEPLMRIHSADRRPSGADPAVPYRGRWFYIAADDLRSRNTFYLVRLLFSLQAADAGGDGVVLTLPVR